MDRIKSEILYSVYMSFTICRKEFFRESVKFQVMQFYVWSWKCFAPASFHSFQPFEKENKSYVCSYKPGCNETRHRMAMKALNFQHFLPQCRALCVTWSSRKNIRNKNEKRDDRKIWEITTLYLFLTWTPFSLLCIGHHVSNDTQLQTGGFLDPRDTNSRYIVVTN